MANVFFVSVTGGPATFFALALNQVDIALIAIGVNVLLAVLMKCIDIAVRVYFKEKNDR